MNRTHFLAVVLGFLCLSGIGQNTIDTLYFYYYKGEKQYIAINTQHALVRANLTEISNLPLDSGIYNSGKELNNRDYSEITFAGKLSPRLYLEQLDTLEKSLNVRVRGYFKSRSEDKLCLSDYFYVCLKQLSDSSLLRNMAQGLSVEIVLQNKYLPHWFVLKTPPDICLNHDLYDYFDYPDFLSYKITIPLFWRG